MKKVLLTENEVNYLVAVLNFFLRNQENAINASKDVLYMVDKLQNSEEVVEQVEAIPE
jgi:hypothetical protein